MSIIDANGNIDTDRLSKELKDALDFDIKYRQTDNMKKRAIRAAGSYDEFKALVSCAHLKKLSKKEVESLSEVKKGWKKSSSTKNIDTTAIIIEEEMKKENQGIENFKLKKSKGDKHKKVPKTFSELDRDLRRIDKEEEKQDFLLQIGIEKVSDLMQRADIDILEEILRIIILYFSTLQSEDCCRDLTLWLQAFETLGSFPLMMKFINKTLLSDIQSLISKYSSSIPPSLKQSYGVIE